MTHIHKLLTFSTAGLFFTAVYFLSVRPVNAQIQGAQFGKNRIQYKTFNWKFITTSNFEIFYHEEGADIARLTGVYAEEEFSRIADIVGFAPYNKIKIFVYNSFAGLRQSNIGLSRQDYPIAGQTNFSNSEIEIAYTGAVSSFRRQLALNISEMLIYEMMYGGNLKDLLQSTYLMSLPDWFMSGAALYIAEGWSIEMDDYVRDALQNRKLRKLSNLEGKEAHLIGQSIWNYIVERYGRNNIANILNLTRIVRNEESSVQNTLGISFQRFLNNWRNYYLEQGKALSDVHQAPAPNALLKENQRNVAYNQPRLSPRADKLAYAENMRGRYTVKVRDLASGKDKTLLSEGYRTINQQIDEVLPLLAWQGNDKVVVYSVKEGKGVLTTIEVSSGRKSTRPFDHFNRILHIDISDDGERMIMSASKNVYCDIFIYDFQRDNIRQITNDTFDNFNPYFLKRSSTNFVFSSNRDNDTLTVRKTTGTPDQERFNIFLFDSKAGGVLRRLTNTLSIDFNPLPISESTILYTSDQRGIRHLYRYNLTEDISSQVSNFSQSIHYFDASADRLAVVSLMDGKPALLLYNNFDDSRNIFTGKTTRQQLIDLRKLAAIRAKAERERRPTVSDTSYINRNEKNREPAPVSVDTAIAGTTTDEIDTDNYQFDTFNRNRRKKLLQNYRPVPSTDNTDERQNQEFRYAGPFNYESKFSVNNLTTSLVIDPLRGWGLVVETSLSDALENHKFNAGLFGLANLRSNTYFAEYKYLKGRLDYQARFDRQGLSFSPSFYTHRYVLNRLQAGVSYPLSVVSRFSGNAFAANTAFTPTSDIDPQVQVIRGNEIPYAGFNLEFVFDNTVITGPNLMDGTRAQIRFEQWYGLQDAGRNFANLSIDARTYRQLGRYFVLATRFTYGQFMGASPKTYRLGGMSNWIFNESDPVPQRDPLFIDQNQPGKDMSDLLFVQYITNLRGFNWNKLYGNNYVLANAEIRMPLIKYFYKSALTSNFLRNLQLVGFTDIGASWSGNSPFSRENALNTIEIIRDPFVARVSNFKNPFLIGLGAGLRTMILGYYTKFDMAWGIEDEIIQKPMFYLTLGYDF